MLKIQRLMAPIIIAQFAITMSPDLSFAKIVRFLDYNFSIEIPDKWVEIPREEHMARYSIENGDAETEGATEAFYAKMFQLDDTEYWLEAPMIGVHFFYGSIPLEALLEQTESAENMPPGFRETTYIDEGLGAVVVEISPSVDSEGIEADIGYLFPGREVLVRVTFLVDPNETLIWKSEFYDIAKSFEFDEGWGPNGAQEKAETVINGVILSAKIAGGALLLALGGAWYYGRRYGRAPNDDVRTRLWWRWPMVPVASFIAGIVATAIFFLLNWFANVMFGGIAPDSIWAKYVTPILSRGIFGYGWVWTAYFVAPAYKVRASLFMTAFLFSLMVCVWVTFIVGAIDLGGWETLNVVLETISLAIGATVGLVTVIEEGG